MKKYILFIIAFLGTVIFGILDNYYKSHFLYKIFISFYIILAIINFFIKVECRHAINIGKFKICNIWQFIFSITMILIFMKSNDEDKCLLFSTYCAAFLFLASYFRIRVDVKR